MAGWMFGGVDLVCAPTSALANLEKLDASEAISSANQRRRFSNGFLKRIQRAGALALLAVQALTAGPSFALGTTPPWGPNGNGTLDHKDDVQWVMFHDTQITANTAAGVYAARFSPLLLKMEGKPFIISGYMMPLGTSMSTNHFVLTRRSPGCPFCPPNEPTEAIEVYSQNFVKPTQAPITIEGKLHFVSSSAQGLFFRMDAAKIW